MARRWQRDDLDRFFDYGVDLSSRTIYVGSEVDEESAADVIKGLHLLDRTTGEITIKLNTPGGCEYNGMAMFDAIRTCGNSVRIIGIGRVMSMGAWIMQAADTRLLTANATVLVHYGSEDFGGHIKDFQRRAQELERLNRRMEDDLIARIRERIPNFSRQDFQTKFSFDCFMSAQEAVDFGLADAVI